MKKKPKRKRLYCPDQECRCVRLHTIAVRKDEKGEFARLWVCPKCFHGKPAGGFCCRQCGHDRFYLANKGRNSRYSRPGAVLRIKACKRCHTDHRTIERIECVVK